MEPSSNIIWHSRTKLSNQDQDWLLTSTPKRYEIVCNECKKQCQKNQHLEPSIVYHIWDPPDISSIDTPDGWEFAPELGAAGPFMVETTPLY